MAASASTDTFELNLTPLLDVVMQLIMFFMMCVNFVSEQVSSNVLLPTSAAAQEIMAKTDVDVLMINIEVVRQPKKNAASEVVRDKHGDPVRELVTPKTTKIIFFGRDPIVFTDDTEGAGLVAAQALLRKIALTLRETELKKHPGKPADQVPLKVPVVIRADQETRYGLVVQLIAQCTKEGFPKVELRALSQPR